MIGKAKQAVRKGLERKWERKYRQELEKKTLSYDTFVKREEVRQSLGDIGPLPSMQVILWEELGEMQKFPCKTGAFCEDSVEIVVLVPNKSGIADLTEQELTRIFSSYPEVQLVYGDEDEWNSSATVRMNPWYKPDFSPDTLGSYYYFGSLLAVRRESLEKAFRKVCFPEVCFPEACAQEEEESFFEIGKKRLYALALQLCLDLGRKEVYHSRKILFHSRRIEYFGMEKPYAPLRENYEKSRLRLPGRGVSVIIPSKDNPAVLENCIASIYKWTKDTELEIIVVDNGSSPENREKIENIKIKYGFNYIYSPMEFNFSAMCNLGARNSKKEHLLFLNDDCEVRQSKWLRNMVEQSALASVGAVGVKLYYPNSKKIQHCGIYGLNIGPVHKLQFKEDTRSYYDRRNRDKRNVLAVTAACLMVKRSLFEEAGGFYEGLRVAFNDVDFCYRLYEMGYDNVVLNEIHLWHHESLSRGTDESLDKLERLMQEKKQLRDRHRGLWGKDPYYHPYLTGDILDINFSCAYEYPYEYDYQEPKPINLPKKVRVDTCLAVVLEYAGRAEEWNRDGFFTKDKNKITIYFQGNALVLGSDNACYENRILLRHRETGMLYGVTPERLYRPDVVANVENQIHTELSGFACYMAAETLPRGVYEAAILAEDRISRQGILRPLNRVVVVE